MTTQITQGVWKYVLGVFLTVTSLTADVQAQSVTIVPSGPIVCAGTKLDAVVTGLNGPLTYQWSNGATTSSIFINQSGFYRVSVWGFVNGVQIRVRSSWAPFLVVPGTNATINPAGPVNVCPGQSVTLFGSGGQFFSSYSWSTGANTRNITVNQTGDYTLTVTNSFGACSTSTSATVHVEVFDAGYQPAITALSPITVCQPGWVNLGADPGFSSYSWSTGSTSQNISVLMDGSQAGAVLDTQTVTLTVSLNNGQCSFTNPGVVLRSVRQPELNSNYCGNLTLTPNDSIKSGLVLTYLSTPDYEFEFEETTAPGVTWTHVSSDRWCRLADVTPALQANKFYLVRVRAIVDGTPYCYGNPCVIGVVNTPAANETNRLTDGVVSAVFPNPSAESFNLVLRGFENDQTIAVRVTDMAGRSVDTFTYDASAGMMTFGQDLSNGIYVVTAQQGNKTTQTKIVKSN
jgi:Secretion system C-terminal sorting domain